MLGLVGQVGSFSTAPSIFTRCHGTRGARLASKAAPMDQDQFYRAVQIADSIRDNNSKLDIEELDRWASELEQFDGCMFEGESSQELCNKEIQDRLDVAQILRLEIELKLRLDYLKDHSNLFAEDVRKNHDKLERQKFKEALLENRGKMSDSGSDLGLW